MIQKTDNWKVGGTYAGVKLIMDGRRSRLRSRQGCRINSITSFWQMLLPYHAANVFFIFDCSLQGIIWVSKFWPL